MTSASTKAYKGLGMEGMVAKWYATNTRKALNEFKELARRISSELPPGSSVLEVAPGPGYFAIELAKLGNYRITGLDISRTFVEIADRNAKEAKVEVEFRHGNVSKMPFESDSFHFILCRAAFKNFADPLGAVQEMYRVLKPGGRGLIIDMRKDAPAGGIARVVDEMGLNAINTMVTKLALKSLRNRAYTASQFQEFFAGSNFRTAEIREDLIGFEIRFEKGTSTGSLTVGVR
jgi:ubiquinone/menaquinone biosynthesis C-methylase UbiE